MPLNLYQPMAFLLHKNGLQTHQDTLELFRVRWFDQVNINPGLLRTSPVSLPTEPRYCNEKGRFRKGSVFQTLDKLVAVHARQTNVNKYHVRRISRGCLQSRWTVR